MPTPQAHAFALRIMEWAQEPLPARIQVSRDVAYGDHRLQRYNVFAPRGVRNAPVLVFWHGGGWTNGYRDYSTCMAPAVTALGMVLVAPSYRLVGEARMPAAFEDCVALLKHLSGHIGEFGGQPDQLYLAGHSAGGHLAALTALRVADRVRAGVPEHAVRACLPISGIMDLHHPSPLPGSLEERVYSMVLADADDDAALSPLCWAVGNRLPVVLSHGDKDSERVMRSNRRLAALLRLQSGSVQHDVWPDADHFQSNLQLRDPDHHWYQTLARLAGLN